MAIVAAHAIHSMPVPSTDNQARFHRLMDTQTVTAHNLPGDVSSTLIRLMLRAAKLPTAQWPAALMSIHPDLPELVAKSNSRISLEQGLALGKHLMSMGKSDVKLGLRMGQVMIDTDLGLPGQIARTAPTLGEALEKFLHFSPLLTRCHLVQPSLLPGMPSGLRFQSPALPGHHHLLSEAILSICAHLIAQLTGRDDALTHVITNHHQAWDNVALQEQLGVAVLTSPSYISLLLHDDALSWRVLTAEPGLHAHLCEFGDQQLRILQRNDTMGGHIRQWLASHLYGGQLPTLEDAAKALDLPGWTVRRRLKAENISFRALRDEMRYRLALDYIADRQLSLGEISFVLGFSSPGAFQRAFKRWSGQPAGRYRTQQREGDNTSKGQAHG